MSNTPNRDVLVGILSPSITGCEEVAVWRLKGDHECPYRLVLNGSMYLTLDQVIAAFDDKPSKAEKIREACVRLTHMFAEYEHRGAATLWGTDVAQCETWAAHAYSAAYGD